jgi:predicted ArsR family transcriptional regulator
VKSTRQRLLDLIRNKPGSTAAELSRALQVTQANVRHHLSNMIEEGLVITAGRNRRGRRGRPARRFSLTALTLQDNFDILSKALLTTSLDDLPPDAETAYLQRVARHLAGEFTPRGPLAQRLVRAIEQLNTLGYQARWEAHADAPRMIFERCPFAALRPEYPELCQLDTYLVEFLLGETVTQIESNAQLDDGYCLFLVGKVISSADTT